MNLNATEPLNVNSSHRGSSKARDTGSGLLPAGESDKLESSHRFTLT